MLALAGLITWNVREVNFYGKKGTIMNPPSERSGGGFFLAVVMAATTRSHTSSATTCTGGT